jgi:hypothetical protein
MALGPILFGEYLSFPTLLQGLKVSLTSRSLPQLTKKVYTSVFIYCKIAS